MLRDNLISMLYAKTGNQLPWCERITDAVLVICAAEPVSEEAIEAGKAKCCHIDTRHASMVIAAGWRAMLGFRGEAEGVKP
jgi:hypothetical protein